MKARIESEFEIEMLIDTFYEKVLEHEELSYFFSEAVMNWEFHKQMFIKYWSKQILFTDSYEGSPLHRHIEVDQKFGRSFTKYHFEEWARLWVETIDVFLRIDYFRNRQFIHSIRQRGLHQDAIDIIVVIEFFHQRSNFIPCRISG